MWGPKKVEQQKGILMKKKVRASRQTAHPQKNALTQPPASPWLFIIPPIILAGLTAIFYSPSLHYAFQFDSVANITKQFSIRHNGFWDLFLKNTRWISYWLNSVYYSIGQFKPFFYRLGNLIIHTTNGLLIFFILFLGLKNLKQKNFFSNNAFSIALFTSILFLLHPVQTQTVSYVIQGQLEGLAALFILGVVLCFFLVSRTRTVLSKAFLTGILFALALLSCGTKEIAIISPALLLLFDWFFIAQGKWESLKKRALLHASIALFIFGIYLYFLKPGFFTSILGLQRTANNNIGNVITQKPGIQITPWMFFRSQFKVILHYLWMFIWPFNISVEYDWVLSRGLLYPDAFFPLLALLGIVAATFQLLRRNMIHLVGFGLLWFFICLAPRSSIIPSPELLVDYKTYLASFGWLFLIASGLVWSTQFVLGKIKSLPAILSTQRYGTQTIGVTIAIILGMLTTSRNTVWRSGIDFWSNVIKNAPGKARAYNNYGVELSLIRKDYEGAVPYFKKAISMDKNYADPLNNIAVAYSHLGRLDDAINSLKRSLKIHPYYPEGYNNLASFYIQKGDVKKAEKTLGIALRLRPHYGKAYFNLGRIHLKRGDKEKAWECFKNCCTKADFDGKFGFSVYAKTSMDLKKYDDAIFAYGKMLQLDPNDQQASFNLANACHLSGSYEKSREIYQGIIARNPKAEQSWYNLAETYFELKQYREALAAYRKSYHLRDRIPFIQMRMAHCLEREGKPYEAKEMVQAFLDEKHPGNPALIAQLKTKARSILAQMKQQHPGRRATTAM